MSARPQRLPALLALAWLALSPAAARGQAGPRPNAPAPDREAAYRRHMANGVKLFQDKNFQAAIVEFRAAYEAKPGPSPLINIALSHKNLFQYVKATEALERALAEHGGAMSFKDKKATEAALGELEDLVGHVVIRVSPPDAQLVIDGEERPPGTAGAPVKLETGKHVIAARAPGYRAAERTVTVVSGQKDEIVELELERELGWVVVRAADPRTRILVDGIPRGSRRYVSELPSGRHVVELLRPNGERVRVPVEISAEKTSEVRLGLVGYPTITEGIATPKEGPALEPLPDERPPPPPAPEPLSQQGLYALGAGTLLVPLGSSAGRFGAAAGVRGGYRFGDVVGAEFLFDYNVVPVPQEAFKEGVDPASLKSSRFGANLRLMTDGLRTRFVGALGGGVAYDSISNSDGAEAFGNLELGLEFNASHYLFGAFLQSSLSSVSTLSDAVTSFGGGLGQFGLGLRAGWGAWSPEKSLPRPSSRAARR